MDKYHHPLTTRKKATPAHLARDIGDYALFFATKIFVDPISVGALEPSQNKHAKHLFHSIEAFLNSAVAPKRLP